MFQAHTEAMSERWSLLQLHDRSRSAFPEQTGYTFLEQMELEKVPVEGVRLPLRGGGWAHVLWVDLAHHHLGVERTFTFNIHPSGRVI